MKIRRFIIIATVFILVATTLTGCNLIDKASQKLGFKNSDFEYIKQNKVDKVVIQSTRDTGFRFIVSEKNNIKDIYDILSSGKPATTKTSLEADYIFEIHSGSDVKKFSYVAGLHDNKQGNFYDENKSYVISKRLDNYIIQNLSFIRKPREFENIYYNSLLKVIENNKSKLDVNGLKVGVDILGDTECTKYMISVDIDDFKRRLKEILPSADIVNKNRENFDVIVSINNYGYKTKTYKSIVTIENRKENSQKKFYITGTYDSNWTTSIEEKMPNDWR
ncbi:hypothetical protein SAMN02745163_03115 [Clostridium cavendishii DSM 21758]|uniref:YhfM-like domain-containing protein n=1 Tax=Clostridium cavendishii DSM 21758 TaxID=1121302 RepID=A0A1M6PDD3_9CLOT|nr:hypothetical protein [Clostridium cavendishii]SHK05890.1 hypothetical protein SAMN02745163_03115 [Clostridium cavendishii DSM 21758]